MATTDERQDTNAEGTGAPSDPEAVLRRIRREAEAIRREEVSEAVDRLAAEGTVTAKRRRALEELSRRIVDSLFAAPAETLRGAERRDDREAVEAARRLFDSGED